MSADLVTTRVAELASAPREVLGLRVVTLRDVADLHRKPVATVRRAFQRRKKRFVQGVDYVMIPGGARNAPTPVGLTESGYALLTKVFDDERSWKLMRELVRVYFRARDAAAAVPADSVIVSRADLDRLHAEAEDGARRQVRLARWVKAKISTGARDLNAWKALGPTTRALALEDPDQVRIPGVEFRAVVADLSAAASPEARAARAIDASEDLDLPGLLAQLVGQAVAAALPGALDRALASR